MFLGKVGEGDRVYVCGVGRSILFYVGDQEDDLLLEGLNEPWRFLEEEHSKLRKQQVQSPLKCSEL